MGIRLLLIGCLVVLFYTAAAAQTITNCPGAPPLRMVVGSQGRMTAGLSNNIRREPTTRGEFLGQIVAGQVFDVLDGPVCADGYAWWQINLNGLVGWTVEGVNRDYWIEPYPPTVVATPAPISAEAAFASATAVTTLAEHEGVIAFVSASKPGGSAAIYVVNPDGANLRLLASGGTGNPLWSPDGKQILYADAAGLEVLDVTAGSKRTLALESPNASEYSWSPDSRQILFTTYGKTGREIMLLALDSGMETNLSDNPANDYSPVWSPDGHWIAFISDRSGSPQLFHMNADGSDAVQLTNDGYNNWVSWTPDGKRIVWIDGQQIKIMDSNGQHVQWLTTDNSANYRPIWSPDGTHLAYTVLNADGFINQLFVLDMRGGIPVQLSRDGVDDAHPSWSPDGTQLIFQSYGGLYRVNADGSKLTLIGQPMGYPAFAAWRPSGAVR